MIVLGLTGSVGMGKSTTARFFAEAGIPVFDSDAAVHALYSSPAAAPVAAAFPGVAKDGTIDRVALAQAVVGDAVALAGLEAIVHPLVRKARDAFLDRARTTGAHLAVVDVPLLFETGADSDVDVVVVVSAPESVQKTRVLQRPGMTAARLAAILARQLPDSEKRRRADHVIETGQGFGAARRQVRDLIATLGG